MSNKKLVFEDPSYRHAMPDPKISFVSFVGKDWEIDEEIEDETFILKFIDRKSSQFFKIGFDNVKERKKFLSKIYSYKPIISEHSPHLEEHLYDNTLYKTRKYKKKYERKS